jgi:EmrB/QacA subfamily drug resistance transporter
MTATTTLPTDISATSETGRRWLMLAVLLGGQFMALLDVTIVNVAMPTISIDLHASGSMLQLIVSGYTIAYAMLLITGARLGTLFGRRRMFLGGMAGFTLASLICGIAPDTGVLVTARFVQGAAAAAMIPQIITVIQSQFTGVARAKALSAYSSVLAVGAVAGQVLGGVLVNADLFGTGWRPVFLVNVPIGLAILAIAPRLLPADTRGAARRVDVRGLATSIPAVLLIVLPLVLGHQQGWPAWTFISLAAGVVLAGVFVLAERSAADPLLDLQIVRIRGVSSGMLALTLVMVAYGGFLFSITLHLQQGLGDSALRSGLTFAPGGAAFGLAGLTWRRLPASWHRALISLGFVLGAVGYLGSGIDLGSGHHPGAGLFGWMVLFGAGFGIGFGALLVHALVNVPPARAADASGLLTTVLQLSQVIGVAVFGSVYLTLATHGSGHAIGTTLYWLTALAVAGALGGVFLARAVKHPAPVG